ncbi:hypothetical protein BH09ACT1_BH09ACT1_26460 [soil metagenome]
MNAPLLRRHRHTRVRVIALVLASALVALGLFGTRNDFTEATWVTSEYANAPLATPLIAPPVITSCVANGGVLGANPTVTLVWHFPTGSGYVVPGNIAYFASASNTLATLLVVAVGPTVATTGPVGVDYTTVFSGSLLSGLLGGSVMVALESTVSGWTSAPASASASMALLGINPTCTIN